MKYERLQEQLKKMKGAPVYECPHCHTVWLIVGGQALPAYTCNTCNRSFNPAQARYVREQMATTLKLPEAA